MEFEVGGDDGGGEFGVGGSSCSCAPDLRRDVVKLLAVLQVRVLVWRPSNESHHNIAHLVSYDGATRRSGICGDDDTSIVESADDGGTSGCGLGERNASGVESDVSVVVAEVEARHGV